MKSKSYNPHSCCGADCNNLGDNPEEPCWGDVEVVDEIYDEDIEDYSCLHMCQGHIGAYYGNGYTKEIE